MLNSATIRQAISFVSALLFVGFALLLSSSICSAQTVKQNKEEWKMLPGEYRLEGVVYSTYAPYKSFLLKVTSMALANGSRISKQSSTIDNVNLATDTKIHIRGEEQSLNSSEMKIGDSVVVLASRDPRMDCWMPREIAVWNQTDGSGYQLVRSKEEIALAAETAPKQTVTSSATSEETTDAPTRFGSSPIKSSEVTGVEALPPAPAKNLAVKTSFSNANSQDQGDVQFDDGAGSAKNTQELQVGAGEILLQGVVRSVEAANGRLVLSTAYFALPNGHVKRLRLATDKTICLNAQTTLLSDAGSTPSMRTSQIRIGAIVTVIGQDLGTGQNLPARIMTVSNPTAKPAIYNTIVPARTQPKAKAASNFPVDLNVRGAAKRIAQIAYQRHQQGVASEYRHRCQALVRTTVQQVTRKYDGFFKGSARSTMEAFRSAGVGRPYTRGTVLKPGDLLYTGQWGGQAGHAMIVGPDGRILDNVGEGIADPARRPIDWIVRM